MATKTTGSSKKKRSNKRTSTSRSKKSASTSSTPAPRKRSAAASDAVTYTPERIDDLLTTREVMELSGRAEVTITEYRAKSQIPYVIIRGDKTDAIRYRRDQIKTWLKDNGLFDQATWSSVVPA